MHSMHECMHVFMHVLHVALFSLSLSHRRRSAFESIVSIDRNQHLILSPMRLERVSNRKVIPVN